MLKRTRKKRGLAIILTLMILSLLLALIGAFLSVNRAGNRLTVGSVERRQAQDAALTAFNYAWFHLDQERGWAEASSPLSGSEDYPAVRPTVRLSLSQSGDDGIVNGIYSPGGDFANPIGTFQMTVRNNLANRSSLPGVVPRRAVGVTVEAEVGGVKRKLQALLRPVPQAHEGVAAGRNLNLDDMTGLLRIESTDPYVNRIAAGDDLNLPFNDDVRFVKHGVAASHGELNLGATDLATASDDAVLAAGEVSGGTFSPNQPTLEVTEFQGDEFALPANTSNLPGGTWVFGSITKSEYREHDVNYEEFDGIDGDGKPKYKKGDVKRKQKRQSLYNVLTSPSGEQWAAGTAIPGSTSDWFPPDPGTLGSEGAAASWGYDLSATGGFGVGEVPLPTSDVHAIVPGLKANVVTAQFVIRSGWKMVASGDFVVEGEGDRSPELYFGYNMTPGGVAEQESLRDGLDAAQDDPSQYMGGIIADGDVNVVGGVLGYGSMIAGGDLTVKASSGLRTAPGLGVVLKGRRITVNAATEPEPALPGEPVGMDLPIFRDAIEGSGSGWSDYEGWLNHQQAQRTTMIEDLSSQSAGDTASGLWTKLNMEIGAGLPLPTLGGGWGGTLNLEQYVRLKEFYQTVATGYNDGEGDPRWLDLSDRQQDAAGRVAGVLDGIAYWAQSYKMSFEDYLKNPDQGQPDMFLEGLVFAEEDVVINADGQSVKLKGSVVAKNGDVSVNGADNIDIVYDRNLLDDLYSGSDSSKLEKVFLTFD